MSEERFDMKNCGLVREMEWAWCLVPTAAWSERWSTWAWCLVSEERFDVKNCGLVREMECAWCLVPTLHTYIYFVFMTTATWHGVDVTITSSRCVARLSKSQPASASQYSTARRVVLTDLMT